MACEPDSLANLYQDQEEVAKCFAHIVYNITQNSMEYEPKHFRNHELSLAEAYCLLWQNAETGKVNGRKFGVQLKISVFAALCVDLCSMEKIAVFQEDEDPEFRIVDMKATKNFLDVAIFDEMRSVKIKHPTRGSKLWRWLIRAVSSDCVQATFDSLVARGILDKKSSGLFGIFKRYPTKNPVPELKLEETIKKIVSEEIEPDSYMLALLVLSRESDRMFMCEDPILRKHFPSTEYPNAKKTLDRVLSSYLK